jgi:hypothetical protein
MGILDPTMLRRKRSALAQLSQDPDVEKIRLFGSRAGGAA